MQSGCRRRDRAALVRVDGLITLAIVRPIGATNVRWQWNGTDAVDGLGDWTIFAGEPNRTAPEEPTFEHLTFEPNTVPFEQHFRPRLQLLPGMHQRLPHFETPNLQHIFLSNSQMDALGISRATSRQFLFGSWEFPSGKWELPY